MVNKANTDMRVLYLIDSLGPGGAERSLAAMAPAYVRRGVDLDVAYLIDRPGVHGDLEAAGARLFSLDGPGGRAGWAWRAERLIAARRPDLVHTTLFEADVAGRIGAGLAGAPVVSSLVNVAYGADHAATPGVRRWKVQGAHGQAGGQVPRQHQVHRRRHGPAAPRPPRPARGDPQGP